MSGDVLDRLRRENPVPETMSPLPIEPVLRRLADPPLVAPSRPRLGRTAERFAVGLSVLLALVVAGVAVVLVGGHGRRPSPSRTASPPAPPVVQSARTLMPLLASFAVLRRPQTKADGSWRDARRFVGEGLVPNLTRLVANLNNGDRIFLVVYRWPSGSPIRLAGTYSVYFWRVTRHGNALGVQAGYVARSLEGPPPFSVPVWISLVPDGVARVQWTMSSTPACRFHHLTGCPTQQRFRVDLPVRDNVAVVRPLVIIGCTPAECRAIQGTKVTWYDARGRVVASLPIVAKPRHPVGVGRQESAAQKAQAIRYDLQHPHHAARSLFAAFVVLATTSPGGVKTAVGDVISRPPLSSLPLDVVQEPAQTIGRFQLDFTQVRQVITPSGVRLYVIPGGRGLCLFTSDGGGSCNLLPGVETQGIVMILGSLGVGRTYRLLPKTIRSLTIRTGRGRRTIRVPDGIYVSPRQRTTSGQ